MHLIKRREENGPRVDVGPMFRGEPPRNLSDAGVIAAADTVNRLPSRDYLGEEPGDLAPNPTAEEQRWTHERELYKKKNEGSPPDVPEELPQPKRCSTSFAVSASRALAGYLDTSYFVKLVRSESESHALRDELRGAAELISSVLLLVEGRWAVRRYGKLDLRHGKREVLSRRSCLACRDGLGATLPDLSQTTLTRSAVGRTA